MPRPILTVVFRRAAELRAQRAHLAKGALLLPLPDPPPEPFAEVLLRVEGVKADSAELEGRVLQIFEGRGMAVAFDDLAAATRKLAPLLDAADVTETPEAGAPSIHWGRPEPPPTEATRTRPAPQAEDAGTPEDENLQKQIATMTTAQKIQLALKGDRTARLLLLKDVNKQLHGFLLQNPRITIDEVRFIASYKQTSPEALETIAGNTDYLKHTAIITALVRNPRTPGLIAAKLVEKLPEAEVRRLAKSSDVPRAVQMAARKRINE